MGQGWPLRNIHEPVPLDGSGQGKTRAREKNESARTFQSDSKTSFCKKRIGKPLEFNFIYLFMI